MCLQRHIIAPDFQKLTRMQLKMLTVAGAYYMSGDERYAEHAAGTLRAFFLDPKTGMHPTLLYAQLRGDSDKGSTVVRGPPDPLVGGCVQAVLPAVRAVDTAAEQASPGSGRTCTRRA